MIQAEDQTCRIQMSQKVSMGNHYRYPGNRLKKGISGLLLIDRKMERYDDIQEP